MKHYSLLILLVFALLSPFSLLAQANNTAPTSGYWVSTFSAATHCQRDGVEVAHAAEVPEGYTETKYIFVSENGTILNFDGELLHIRASGNYTSGIIPTDINAFPANETYIHFVRVKVTSAQALAVDIGTVDLSIVNTEGKPCTVFNTYSLSPSTETDALTVENNSPLAEAIAEREAIDTLIIPKSGIWRFNYINENIAGACTPSLIHQYEQPVYVSADGLTLEVLDYQALGEHEGQTAIYHISGARYTRHDNGYYVAQSRATYVIRAVSPEEVNIEREIITGDCTSTLTGDATWQRGLISSLVSGDAIVCTVTANTNVNQRLGAGTNFVSITRLAEGVSATAIGQARATEDDKVWYRLDTGAWVRQDVVTAEESCENLPIEQ